VGRIEAGGQILVDLEEAMELLSKSRATVFRMLSAGDLTRVHVVGTRTLYIDIGSIRDKVLDGPQFRLKGLEPMSTRKKRQMALCERFPHIFKGRPNLPLELDALDPLPSGEE